jgi:hypothetical protein
MSNNEKPRYYTWEDIENNEELEDKFETCKVSSNAENAFKINEPYIKWQEKEIENLKAKLAIAVEALEEIAELKGDKLPWNKVAIEITTQALKKIKEVK